jgi:hypothetical protein
MQRAASRAWAGSSLGGISEVLKKAKTHQPENLIRIQKNSNSSDAEERSHASQVMAERIYKRVHVDLKSVHVKSQRGLTISQSGTC